MKKIFLPALITASVLFFSFTSHAQDYRLGLGIRLSNASPTLSNAFSIKYFAKPNAAIEGLISFGGSRFGIGGLYEIHTPMATPGLKWYYGGGAYIGVQHNTTYLGPTGVIGLDYKFDKVPLNLSLDWKPELDILPAINFIPDAFGFSARFVLQ